MEYNDFIIQLVPKGGREFWVTVLGSAAGDNQGVFRLPFEVDEIQSLRSLLGQALRGNAANTKCEPSRDVKLVSAGRNPVSLQQVGDQLFRALFVDSIRSLFDRSLGSMQQGCGLRIKIHIDPDNVDLVCLCNLPWEILFWQDGREFLSLSRNNPIVRSLATPRPSQPFRLDPPLRILVVISSPPGQAPIDIERERSSIETAWGQLKDIEIKFSENQPLTSLRDNLLSGGFNILHYIGHGSFDPSSGEGGLILVDDHGLATTVSGRSFANALRNLSSLRLVFLNACNTAETTTNSHFDPFAGVAAALIKAGLPAVLAMQFPISDGAAISFSERFYERLATGDPPEAATVEGRLVLENSRSLEWITPVLFTRTPGISISTDVDGQLAAKATHYNSELIHQDTGEKIIQYLERAVDIAEELTEDWEEAEG